MPNKGRWIADESTRSVSARGGTGSVRTATEEVVNNSDTWKKSRRWHTPWAMGESKEGQNGDPCALSARLLLLGWDYCPSRRKCEFSLTFVETHYPVACLASYYFKGQMVIFYRIFSSVYLEIARIYSLFRAKLRISLKNQFIHL